MTWSSRFALRERLRGSLWVVPLLGAVLGVVAGALLSVASSDLHDQVIWRYSPATASTVLTTVVGATAALTGFVITVTVLAVQMAAGTFSPRYMRLWYRDGVLKATLAALLGTLTLSFSLLRRIEEDFVPNLGVTAVGVLLAASILMFLLFFNRFVHRLRPVAVTALVARAGRDAFFEAARQGDREDIVGGWYEPDDTPTVVVRASRPGAIRAIDPDGLARWARAHDAVLALTRAVGDFVPTGAPLIRVYGGQNDSERAQRELEGMIALGVERTIQQDPGFAIRIMVDIAIRALSPGINDPTTAVQVLDHLGETLRLIGAMPPREGPAELHRDRTPVVVVPARRFEDFLALGVTEIREFGASSIQVMRRLRAILEELRDEVHPAHRPLVEDEIRRLDATVAETWSGTVDLDCASVADLQGIGGVMMRVDRPS